MKYNYFDDGITEEFINYIGMDEIEMVMCLCEQYPEYREKTAQVITKRILEFLIKKELLSSNMLK